MVEILEYTCRDKTSQSPSSEVFRGPPPLAARQPKDQPQLTNFMNASVWNSPQPWIAIAVTAMVFLGLQLRRRLPVDLMFLGALVAVTLTGVISPAEALKNFANPAVITIAGLLVVAAGLRSTGVLDWLGQILLGDVSDVPTATRRLALVLVTTSAFVLNTALVAMTVPFVADWCRRRQIAPSRILISVSYLAILGGVCSLIGTSTTLIVNGLLRQQEVIAEQVIGGVAGRDLAASEIKRAADRFHESPKQFREFASHSRPMGLFEIGKVGIPVALVGALVLLYLGPKWLPDRSDMVEEFGEHRREFLVEMRITPTCRLVGKSVEDAGLRQLEGLYLIEISRAQEVITPVKPTDVLRADDRLVFSGVVSQIMDLEKIPGLEPIMGNEPASEVAGGRMVEAVLSRTSPLIGRTIKESNFRQAYDAAIVAVHRNGEVLPNKIGSIRLEAGDTLLLQTRIDFAEKFRNSVDFYLVSNVDGYEPPKHQRAVWASVLGLVLIALLILCSLGPVQARVPFFRESEAPALLSMLVAFLMVVTRCVTVTVARSSLNMQVLLAIVGALGLGEALAVSGAADGIATLMVRVVGPHPFLALVVIYLLAMLFTELITNNAVATILLPIAMGVSWELGCSPKPFIMAIALAASLSFLTPVGYQTNLMVMGPGGYVSRDYLRMGLPIATSATLTALALIPWIWPF